MAATHSTMLALGTQAPPFLLPDTVSGETISLKEIASEKGTVVMFICNHCPFVVRIIDKLVELAKIYQNKGITFVAINANDIEKYPEDSPNNMSVFAKKHKFSFPYLYDATQTIAKAYQAACTPDFYLFDHDLCCVYRGQFDASRPGNDMPVTGDSLKTALDQLLAGQPIPIEQQPSIGCNIKWK